MEINKAFFVVGLFALLLLSGCVKERTLFIPSVANPQVYFYPEKVITTSGTNTTGEVSLLFYEDEKTYNITESTGASPLIVYMNFTNVYSFNKILVREKYEGSATHFISFDLWDYDSNSWENYFSFSNQGTQTYLISPVLDTSDHIKNGVVEARFNHIQPGVSSHVLRIDVVNLLNGGSI